LKVKAGIIVRVEILFASDPVGGEHLNSAVAQALGIGAEGELLRIKLCQAQPALDEPSRKPEDPLEEKKADAAPAAGERICAV